MQVTEKSKQFPYIYIYIYITNKKSNNDNCIKITGIYSFVIKKNLPSTKLIKTFIFQT